MKPVEKIHLIFITIFENRAAMLNVSLYILVLSKVFRPNGFAKLGEIMKCQLLH